MKTKTALPTEDSMKRKALLSSISFVISSVVFVAILCSTALGQTGTSSVRGTVVDPTGKLVSGASVTLTNAETNTSRTQTTSDSGIYVFELVPPGPYRVDVEAAGFKKAVVTNVQALVAKTNEVNVLVEVGAVVASITVTANSGSVLH